MDQLKSAALCICTVALFFGIIKSILPSGKYEKYMRLALCLIFMLLTINGIRSVLNYGKFSFENMNLTASDVSVEEQLSIQIKNHINEKFETAALDAECYKVNLSIKDGNYFIESISIKNGTVEAVNIAKEITGLDEDCIYVPNADT